LVVERARRLLPIEIKSGTPVRVDDARTVDSFCAEFGNRRPFGIVAYDGKDVVRPTRTTVAAPLGTMISSRQMRSARRHISLNRQRLAITNTSRFPSPSISVVRAGSTSSP